MNPWFKIRVWASSKHLATIDNHRNVTRNKEIKLVEQKQLFKKCLKETNNLKIDIHDPVIENEKSAEEIKQCEETHSRAAVNYDVSNEDIENKISVMK